MKQLHSVRRSSVAICNVTDSGLRSSGSQLSKPLLSRAVMKVAVIRIETIATSARARRLIRVVNKNGREGRLRRSENTVDNRTKWCTFRILLRNIINREREAFVFFSFLGTFAP